MTKKSAQRPAVSDNGWKGYVNYNPNESDRAAISLLLESPAWDFESELERFTQSGYTVSFSHDDANSCERLSLTGKTPQNPNVGYTLSVRASSVLRCMGIATYYCNVLCQSQDWLIDKAGKEVW